MTADESREAQEQRLARLRAEYDKIVNEKVLCGVCGVNEARPGNSGGWAMCWSCDGNERLAKAGELFSVEAMPAEVVKAIRGGWLTLSATPPWAIFRYYGAAPDWIQVARKWSMDTFMPYMARRAVENYYDGYLWAGHV